jgi:hypothetical protein
MHVSGRPSATRDLHREISAQCGPVGHVLWDQWSAAHGIGRSDRAGRLKAEG